MDSVRSFELRFVDPNPGMCRALEQEFAGKPGVQVVHSVFEQLEHFDCMVSPANSFGLMDGGVDAAIIRYFGVRLMYRVQKRILAEYRGEQPVGTCMIVETGNPEHPFLAHAPTMRVPMTIARTDYPYLAMWAMLLAVQTHNQTEARTIKLVACPGLGTGVGELRFSEAARQMALAYANFLNPPPRIDWDFANARQTAVRRGGDFGLLYP